MQALLCLLVLSAGAASAQPQDAHVVARVNGTPITVERFNAAYVQHLILTGRNDTPQQRHAYLESLIDTYLLAEEARRRGFEDADYEAYMEQRIKKSVGGRFFEILFVDSLPDLPEADVRAAFRKSKEQVVVRHLFYRSPEEAEAAYTQLEAGTDFLALANACFETAAFDSMAGYLGTAGYWELDDAFAEAAFALPVGQYSRPVRSRYGWHIIRVEDKLYNPLLTEWEYQQRRKDIRNRVRARRFRLEGDRFIYTFMSGLDVQVDPSGMAALQESVRRILSGPDVQHGVPRVSIEAEEVRVIRQDLTPETVLATYLLDGERRAFSALDYFKWLEALPYKEVRYRSAASVGRALRNEVLALKGLAMGLEQDEQVQEEVLYRANVHLAHRLREHLHTQATAAPTEAEQHEAFERMGYRKLKQAAADFWRIPFATLAEAEAAKRAITAGSLRADAYDAYERFTGRDLRDRDELSYHVQRAPLGVPVVVGTGNGWYVVEVEDRTLTYTTFEEVQDEIERVLSRYLPEVNLIKELRQQATIEVDTVRFEQMMQLDASS